MSFWKCAAALLAVLATAAAAAFDLQGHRGARGLAPENTLPAFERALAIGVDTLELDVGVTADGVVVISHDPYLNPAITRDASFRWLPGTRGPLLKSLTFAQLQAYDVGRVRPDSSYAATLAAQQPRDGTRIPALKQLFELAQARRAPVRFNIETKINPTAPEDTVDAETMTVALLKAVRDAGMGSRVSIQSFDWRTLQLVQKLEPRIPTVYLTTANAANSEQVRDGTWTAGLRPGEQESLPRLVKRAGGAAWSPHFAALTEAALAEAHALGLKVVPWTVNAPADMERLLAWGVDGLITDYPDRLREAMRARGLPLPAPLPPQ